MNDLKQLTCAIQFTAQAYKTKGLDCMDEPFINHPLEVLHELVMTAESTDTVLLAAAVLHDLTQYTDVTADEIRQQFGDQVANLVDEVHYDSSAPKQQIQDFILGRTKDLSSQASMLVLADSIVNIRAIEEVGANEFAERKRAAWARAVIEEMPCPNPALKIRFDDLMAEFYERTGYDPEEHYSEFAPDPCLHHWGSEGTHAVA